MLERTRHYRTAGKDDLTPRQREVLQLVADGKTNPEIAEHLGITLDGAKFHIREILAKLEVDSREEAAEWWKAQRGIGTRVASFLRGLTPSGWLKPAAIGAAVGGTTLALVAVGFAVNGGRGRNDDVVLPSAQSACDPDELGWKHEFALDPALGLRFTWSAESARRCNFGAMIELAVAGPGGAGLLTPLSVESSPIAISVAQELGIGTTPVVSGILGNVCEQTHLSISLTVGSVANYVLDVPIPPCTEPSEPARFEAAWTATISSRPVRTIPFRPVPDEPVRLYTVKAGDTLPGIALEHGVSVAQILFRNPELRAGSLKIGQQLLIPPPP